MNDDEDDDNNDEDDNNDNEYDDNDDDVKNDDEMSYPHQRHTDHATFPLVTTATTTDSISSSSDVL